MQKILIIEDEPEMAKSLRDNLEHEGYEVDTALDGNEGLKKTLHYHFDLILLDIMLPDISGFDVCRTLRRRGTETPVIMLTAKAEEIDKVLGLELGADDYMIKPFSLRELLARIRANLRRASARSVNSEGYITIGNLRISLETYRAFNAENEVRMSHKEFQILQYLYENRDRTVTRDDLMANVWGINYDITTRTVDNFIVRLRQKIESDSGQPKIILTVHGTGYKMALNDS